jgi:hypothetical protein
VGRDPAERPESRELRQQPSQFLSRGTVNRSDRVE